MQDVPLSSSAHEASCNRSHQSRRNTRCSPDAPPPALLTPQNLVDNTKICARSSTLTPRVLMRKKSLGVYASGKRTSSLPPHEGSCGTRSLAIHTVTRLTAFCLPSLPGPIAPLSSFSTHAASCEQTLLSLETVGTLTGSKSCLPLLGSILGSVQKRRD